MAVFDLPLSELERYQPPLTRASDFEVFWEQSLAEPGPLKSNIQSVDYPVPEVNAFQATYHGWQGARVSAWYLRPHGLGPFPAIVFYHPYLGTKLDIYHYLAWVLQGYAVLAVDIRGQPGSTPDTSGYSTGHSKGWMTKGILSKEEYYYRGVYVDAVRAIDFLAHQDEVDIDHIGLTGFSQGGGLSLAVAALDSRPALTMPVMPYLCHFERPLEVCKDPSYPYWEIAEYLRHAPRRSDQVFSTLSYFDTMNLADKITCPALMSVGLNDGICPPSTVFAVYNHLKNSSKRHMAVFPYHEHEHPDHHWKTQMQWANHFLRGVASLPA